MKKIIVYSEVLYPPFDEGIRNTAYQLLKTLSNQEIIALGLTKANINSEDPEITGIPTNKLLISYKLYKKIKAFSPDALIYIPGGCGTFWSFVRGWILKRYIKNKKVLLILLQPRKYTKLKRFAIKLFKPYKVLTPSQIIIKDMESLNIKCDFFPLGVDQNQFKPLQNKEKKIELRHKYNLPEDRYLILHVGHINNGRNLKELISLQGGENQVVILGSTSTPTQEGIDQKLKNKLEKQGIIIITQYINNMEEIYQLSDLYVFPVKLESGVISIPLTILEAMACNLPILTRNIGTLEKLFEEGKSNGFLYYSNEKQLIEKFKIIKKEKEINTKNLVQRYTWENTLKLMLDIIHSD